MPPAVVIGLDHATGLQTARILAQRGVPVIGIAADLRHPCCRTRVCREIIAVDTGTPPLIDALLALGSRLSEKAVLFPCTDLSVLLISRGRSELEQLFHLVLGAGESIEMLIDKARFASWAELEGLPVPRTRLLRTTMDAHAAAQELRFPCVLKPAVKTPAWKRNTRAKAFRVENAPELHARFAQCIAWAQSLIVQEWVAGGDENHFTCNCYFTKSGEPVVSFTSRKLRQWPPVGGEGCLSEEVNNEVVRSETLRLFRRAGHRGLGYAELKLDARSGKYLILEPNVGRPTGRSAQAEAAGVELLFSQYCDALDWPLPPAREQRNAGIKWIHFRRDLQAAFHHWRTGELTLSALLRSWRGPKAHALFSWSDPVPFWIDILHAVLSPIRGKTRPAARVAAPLEASP